MKKYLWVAVLCACVITAMGCGDNSGQDSPAITMEPLEKEDNSKKTQNDDDTAAIENSGVSTENTDISENADTVETSDPDDYSGKIQKEVDQIVSESSSLKEEVARIDILYQKYDDMSSSSENQASMNVMSQWGTLVWKDECVSLLERIKEKDSSYYQEIKTEYDKWESFVPVITERMTYIYEGGSIYPTMYSYHEAMRYKEEAYGLSECLAELINDVGFVFPNISRCGYYGDYEGDSYLIITEGMEDGVYNIRIHFDDSKDVTGWATIDNNLDGGEYMNFTSDDENLKGYITYSRLEASFSVTETDNSVVGPEGSYTFTFKY